IHAPEGDYIIYVIMYPFMPGRGGTGFYLSGPSIQGSGAVCSPHGEIYDSLRLSGSFVNRRIGVKTDGEPVGFSLSQRLNFLGTNSNTRLNLGFRGAWHNPNLVLDERGSLRRMFNPDGTMYTGDPHKRPEHGAPLALTLHEGGRAAFKAAC